MKYEIVGPLYYTVNKLEKHVNLLLFTKDCNNRNQQHTCNHSCSKRHYCWIKDRSRLVSHQISPIGRCYFCDGCLSYFKSPTAIILHQKYDCNHTYALTPSTDLKIDKFGSSVPENILKFEVLRNKCMSLSWFMQTLNPY